MNITFFSRKHCFIMMTFLIAMMLDVLPLPGWVTWIRPQWTLLVLIYWSMAIPDFINIFSAFFIGIVLDLLNGSLLGEHAFAMIVTTFIVIKIYKLVRVYPIVQQMIMIMLLVLLYQLMIFGVQGVSGTIPLTPLFWTTILTSAIVWPWIFLLLRGWRQRLQII